MKSQSSKLRIDMPRWWKRPAVWVPTTLFVIGFVSLAYAILPSSGEQTFADSGQLAHLGRALLVYGLDHQGRYPATLSELLRAEDLPAAMSRDPDNGGEYLFFAAGKLASQFGQNDVVIADPEDFSAAGGDVLYGDGSVRFLNTTDFKKATEAATLK